MKKFLTSSRAKRGLGALILTLVFIAVVIGVNFAAAALQNAVPSLSVDLTSNGMFRLSDETKNFLNGIDDDITITALYDEDDFTSNGTYFKQANAIVRRFAEYSPHITLTYSDYESNKAILDNRYPNEDLSNACFVIESTQGYSVLGLYDIFEVTLSYTGSYYSYYITSSRVEQALATGILTSVSDELSTVAFISGVGTDSDFLSLSSLLEENAFNVVTVPLLSSDIPEEADIAVLFAPVSDLSVAMTDKLRTFLNGEDKTLIYIAGYQNIETPNIDALLEEYGLALSDGFMYETDESMWVEAYTDPPASRVNYGEIYVPEYRDIPFVSPNTRAVIVSANSNGVMLYSSETEAAIVPIDYLLSQTENVTDPEAETEAEDETEAEELTFTEYVDSLKEHTPVVAAAAGTHDDGSQIIVFGSSDAFSTLYLSDVSNNNSAYIVNVCNIAANEEPRVIIESKSMSPTVLNIIYRSTVSNLTFVFRWIVPAVMVLAAAVVFIVRRRK